MFLDSVEANGTIEQAIRTDVISGNLIITILSFISSNFSSVLMGRSTTQRTASRPREPANQTLHVMYMAHVSCINRASRPSVILASSTALQPLK
jgi:hypothetical protein